MLPCILVKFAKKTFQFIAYPGVKGVKRFFGGGRFGFIPNGMNSGYQSEGYYC